jgi:zinc transport system permease protein
MALAMVIGCGAAGAGVAVSAEIDTAPGATTVILALVAFVAISIGSAAWRMLRRRAQQPREVEPPDVVLQS